ncbi:hypothetical protein HY492_03160 [Candidatus Woesearchaeota archaeon]|nr:hypothetical protein [Candidatus Woesearchaeota archaeon]
METVSLEATVNTHHAKATICKREHSDTSLKAPVADARVMNVYCPKCNVQYTRLMTRTEKRKYC